MAALSDPSLVCPHCGYPCEELVVHVVGMIEYAWSPEVGQYRVVGTPDREALAPVYRSACCDVILDDADQVRVSTLLVPVPPLFTLHEVMSHDSPDAPP
jgi:hypothetical protein